MAKDTGLRCTVDSVEHSVLPEPVEFSLYSGRGEFRWFAPDGSETDVAGSTQEAACRAMMFRSVDAARTYISKRSSVTVPHRLQLVRQ